MSKISYGRDTFNMCLCGGCPVNKSSDCERNKEEKIFSQIDQIEKENKMPPPEDLPGIYCSRGKSDCRDLNKKMQCLCPGCPVYINNNLKNSYYCLIGSANEVG